MTLPSSGPMSANMINVELGRVGTAPFDINGTPERALAGVPSGEISFSDFYGKSNGDPFYSSTNLLLHNDAVIPSNVLDDYSFVNINAALIPTAGSLDTSVKKFGAGSVLFNGPSAGITCSAGANPYTRFDLNATNWTWEMWTYETNTVGGSLVSHRAGGTTGWVWTTSGIRANINSSWSETQMAWTKPSLNAWHFMVWQKTGTTLNAYVDGVLVATKTGVTSINNVGASADIQFGSATQLGEQYFKGNMDDIRFTRGVARYTANFTPPTQPFPNN